MASPASGPSAAWSCIANSYSPSTTTSAFRMSAKGYGLRSVAPWSMPSRQRSLAYWNSPFTFGTASSRGAGSPMTPRTLTRAPGRGGASVMWATLASSRSFPACRADAAVAPGPPRPRSVGSRSSRRSRPGTSRGSSSTRGRRSASRTRGEASLRRRVREAAGRRPSCVGASSKPPGTAERLRRRRALRARRRSAPPGGGPRPVRARVDRRPRPRRSNPRRDPQRRGSFVVEAVQVHRLRRALDRLDDLSIAGATAEIARQRFADLGERGLRVLAQQGMRGDHEPGSAEAALHGAGFDERPLDRIERAAVGEALDGAYLTSVRRGGEDETGTDEDVVEQHRAGAAFALLARVLAPRKAEPLAQRREERLVRLDRRLLACAVHRHGDARHAICATRLSARAPMTARACRRYAAVPRTSSIGLAAAATRRPSSFAALSLGRCGRSQPASSKRPLAKPSASAGRMIVGPHEPSPIPTRLRARSTTMARPAIEIAIAFRVLTNM